MSARSTYRGYEIRERTVRDGDGFARYDAEIMVRGQWTLASCEALDDETIERDLDTFIDGMEAPHLSRQPQAARQNGDHKWCSSAMDTNAVGERGKGMIKPSSPPPKTKSKPLPKVRSLAELRQKAAEDPRYHALALRAARNLAMPDYFRLHDGRGPGRERDELSAAFAWFETCALEAGDDESGVVGEVNFCR